jgi:hypothetical protein
VRAERLSVTGNRASKGYGKDFTMTATSNALEVDADTSTDGGIDELLDLRDATR